MIKFNVFFAMDSITLKKEGKALIRTMVKRVKSQLTAKSEIAINITGWVQPTRISPRIDWLSINRARAVSKYLKKFDITAKLKLFAPGEAKRNVPKSRRASAVITWTNAKLDA